MGCLIALHSRLSICLKRLHLLACVYKSKTAVSKWSIGRAPTRQFPGMIALKPWYWRRLCFGYLEWCLSVQQWLGASPQPISSFFLGTTSTMLPCWPVMPWTRSARVRKCSARHPVQMLLWLEAGTRRSLASEQRHAIFFMP